MRKIVSYTTAIFLAPRRAFSTSSCRHEAITVLKTRKCIALAHKQTRDPLWRLLDALHHPRHLLGLSEALHVNGISIQAYERWKPVMHGSGLSSALQEKLHHPPSWVVLFLINSKVRTSQHAQGPMMELLCSHLEVALKERQGPLILLASIQLARFNLVVPLRQLVGMFLNTWIEDPGAYFNLMLQVISCIPNRTVESANLAVLLLKATESRQLKLTNDTYEALLNDRFVTLQLTKYLQTRMVREGFIPHTAHLEAYLRLFAKDGVIHDARKYYKAIRMGEPLPDKTSTLLDPPSAPSIRAITTMLGAHQSATSAFTFLRNLRATNSLPESIVPSRARGQGSLTRLNRTKFLSIHDFTAALCVIVRDRKSKPFHLIKMFDRVPGGRPTVATYTILIRGLILRGDFVNAVSFWKRLLKSGLVIDSEALATGIVALTRVGRPYDAFVLIEQYAVYPGNDSVAPLRKSLRVTPKVINDYMVALNRIQRPDVVFGLWDNMERLYEIAPNSLSLSILLQSARLAHKLDDTLSGALVQLSLKNPFRRREAHQGRQTREEAVETVRQLLYDSKKKENAEYRSGIWNGQLPADASRKVFLQALFGMAHAMGKYESLLATRSPAGATRAAFDSDPATLGFPKLGPTKYKFEPFSDLIPPTGTPTRTHYPTVTVTNKNCLDYIVLLGLDSRAVEVPLVLAWMKTLGLRPSESILGLSLALWSEVSVQAPLVERWQGGPGKGEYVRLVEWVTEWVGEARVPSQQVLEKWERIVGAMRERR